MSASNEEAVPPTPIQLRLCIVSHRNIFEVLCSLYCCTRILDM